MINTLACRCALTIISLLSLVTAPSAQTAPTPQRLEFVRVLVGRIRSAGDAELARLKTQQVNTGQSELTWLNYSKQATQLEDRIACLRSGATRDRAVVQQVNLLQRQLFDLNNRLTLALTNLRTARQNQLNAERAIATKDGQNNQLAKDLDRLQAMWELQPQSNWPTIMKHLLEVASEKQLKSSVTILAGTVPVDVKYRLVNGGPVFSKPRCTHCVLILPVGYYNFWINRGGPAAPTPRAEMLFKDGHSIDLSQL